MNTTELIEIAKECCFSRQVVGDETALITFRSEQLQQFAQRIEQPHLQQIAELEKDCEILQTNLDAALMQVKQLREALQELLHCPAIHDVYGDDKDEETHEAERIARKALEETK